VGTLLRTDLPDHRRATEEQLVEALRNRDPLALAEAYHRSIPAAHATARRLLSGSSEVEALLREVYTELWSSPPNGAALEGWIRARCFELAAEDLRERDAAPASPSLTTLLPELPRPEVRYLDAAERALAELGDAERKALLLAHDKGVPSEEQNVPDAGAALVTALIALAGPEPGSDTPNPQACDEVPFIADWILGLLPPERATRVADEVAARPECTALAKALRRGRRRLEGLPPTPDMGQRVLVTVLAGAPAPVPVPAPAAAAAPAAGAAGVAATPASALPSALDDTGDLTPITPGAPPEVAIDGPPRSDSTSIYAELSALDEVDDAEHPIDLGDDEVVEEHEVGDEGELPYAPLTRQRSRGSRILVWILGALFMIAGVVAGLYLGLTLLS
jgi:DNA-directed RNA polymerase specialized sigma24 family protein